MDNKLEGLYRAELAKLETDHLAAFTQFLEKLNDLDYEDESV